ncbi:MAG: molybdopterin-dependent oxidoreductase, partial [Acidimicrobiia bacterium]|nr:molybdopterin-dependent oxidoreductase [Acidimicrobiia bacterium]
MTSTTPASATLGASRKQPWWQGVLAGLVAAIAALGVAELIAAIDRAWRSPVFDVGDRVIDLVPSWVKDFAIAVFGTNDKIALLVGIFALLAVFAGAVGYVAFRYGIGAGLVGLGIFGALGAVAAVAGEGGVAAMTPSVVGAIVGGALLYTLHRMAIRPEPDVADYFDGATRRSFLKAAGAITAGAAIVGVSGRRLGERFSAETSRSGTALPQPSRPLDPIPGDVSFAEIDGLSSFMTPNADFYRIDTALVVPQVPIDTFELGFTGMIDDPMTLSYEDLIDRPLIESDITLTCVSNEVGGQLVGNARWLGVPLADLLAEVGVQPGSDQLVGRSVDGYTAGFPVAAALDGRDAIVAIGMNGEPLPLEHGFPAR